MSMMQALRQLVFPINMDDYFSEKEKEKAALRVASARLSRGNANTQDSRVTTDRKFEEQMDEYAAKVTAKKYIFQR